MAPELSALATGYWLATLLTWPAYFTAVCRVPNEAHGALLEKSAWPGNGDSINSDRTVAEPSHQA